MCPLVGYKTRALVDGIDSRWPTITGRGSLSGVRSLRFSPSRKTTHWRRAWTSWRSWAISSLLRLSRRWSTSSLSCHKATCWCRIWRRWSSSCSTEAFRSTTFLDEVAGGDVALLTAEKPSLCPGRPSTADGGALAVDAEGWGAEGGGWVEEVACLTCSARSFSCKRTEARILSQKRKSAFRHFWCAGQWTVVAWVLVVPVRHHLHNRWYGIED